MNTFKRIALRCLALVVMFDVIWFFGTRAYLNSEAFLKKINTAQLQFKVRDGYSPWPGSFFFKEFSFTGYAEEAIYEIKADSVRFRFNFMMLPWRKVSINGLVADNVTIAVGDGLESSTDNAARERLQKLKDEEIKAAIEEQRNDDKDEHWTTIFSGAEFKNLREVKVASWVWSGHADLEASFQTDSNGVFALHEAEADAKDLNVIHGDQKFATIDLANITASIDSVDLNEKDWKVILPKIETRWRLKGKLDRLESLDSFLANLDWLALGGSALNMDGDVGLQNGAWRDGSQLIFSADTVHIDLLHQHIFGPAAFKWEVKDTNHLELKFGEFTLNKGRDGEGQGMTVTVDTPDKKVLADLKVWDVHAVLPSTRVKRVQFLQDYIPGSLPLKLEKGEGLLQGEFHASSDETKSKGHFDLKINDLAAVYKNSLRFVGSADSKIKINRLDLAKSEIGIEDAGVEVRDLSFLDKKNWQGALHFTDATVKYEKPTSLTSKVELSGDNLQPVLAFLMKDKSFPGWIQNAFDLKQPKVNFRIAATETAFQLRDFKAKAGDLAIEGWMDQSPRSARARFILDYAGLTGGYGLDNETSQWKFSNVRQWYEEQGRTKL